MAPDEPSAPFGSSSPAAPGNPAAPAEPGAAAPQAAQAGPALAAVAPAAPPAPHEALDVVELQALQRRRAAARFSADAAQTLPRVGLALSGGGVRSATFALGLLRGLAKGGLLKRIDFLSTVSGGGYTGSMFGRLAALVGIEDAQKALADDRGDALDWLRRNGRYLTPTGARDYGIGAVTYLRALLAIHTEAMIACMALGLLVIAPHLWHFSLQWLDVAAWQSWFSPWWGAAALLAAMLAPGAIGAYWTARDSQPQTWRDLALAGAFGLGALALWPAADALQSGMRLPPDAASLGLLATLSLALGMVAEWVWLWRWLRRKGPGASQAHAVAVSRNALTRLLRGFLLAVAGLLGLGALDRASWWVLERLFDTHELVWSGVGLGGLAVLALRVLAQPLQQVASEAGTRMRQWAPRLINLAGWGALLVLLMFWLVVLQWFVFAPDTFSSLDVPPWIRAAGVAVVCALWMGLTAGNHHMANGSSLHSFYRARLVRAYLAVGNAQRGLKLGNAAAAAACVPEHEANDVTRVVEGDDVPLADYLPHERGGPIHLVNTCLNQTRDGKTDLYNADRKGSALTVSALGMEVESGPGRATRVELARAADPGTLGRWAAISGAAASPGAGSYTSRGLALLLYFLGVRLGHWVRASGPPTALKPASAFGWRFMPKPLMLVSEATAMFFGSERPWWYLSDGGHFENTGAYALLRRELDFIILSDASSDGRFEFGDIENLVRKARIDLGCEIEFYGQEAIEQHLGKLRGTLTVLPPEKMGDQYSSRGVLLARVRYRSHGGAPRKQATLLVIKPNLHEALDVDLIGYARANPEFPHESTGDQSFDEAQWESYQRLGEDFGRALSNTWLSNVPGWQRPAQHGDAIAAARLMGAKGRAAAGAGADKPEAAAAATPPWRRSARAAAIGTTIGLGASGTLLLSLWQAQEQIQRSAQEAQKQVRDLYVEVSRELRDFGSACPQLADHVVARTRLLYDLRDNDALPPLERAGVARLFAGLNEQCSQRTLASGAWGAAYASPYGAEAASYGAYGAAAAPAGAASAAASCTPARRRQADELCEQLQRPATENFAFAYWLPRSTPDEQERLAAATWERMAQALPRRSQPVALARVEPAEALPAPSASVGAPPEPTAVSDAAAAGTEPDIVPRAGAPGPAEVVGMQPGDAASARVRAACGLFEINDGLPTLYIQVYDDATAAQAVRLRATLNQAVGDAVRVAGIDNVNRSADLRGKRRPVPWPQPTFVVHDDRNRLCASALAAYVQDPWFPPEATESAWVRSRPPGLEGNGRPGVIELWLPPSGTALQVSQAAGNDVPQANALFAR